MQKLRNVYIKPLMPPPRLAYRQWQIMRGLLADNMNMDEIRGLMWYDAELEALYPVPDAVPCPPEMSPPAVEAVPPVEETAEDRVRRLGREKKARQRARQKGDGMDLNPDPDDVRHGGKL